MTSICLCFLSILLFILYIQINRLNNEIESIKLRIDVHKDVIKTNVDDIADLEIWSVEVKERLGLLEQYVKILEEQNYGDKNS